MQLIIIGVHQRTAPVAVREHLAFSPATIAGALHRLREFVDEGFIISTCNRVEVCGLLPDDQLGDHALRRFLASQHEMALEDLTPHLYTLTGVDAVRHIFRLAAGLDSMVLGEDQIMGQIKAALAAAHDVGTLGNGLHRLLEAALVAGKLVRTQTGIARAHISVVSVGLDLARQTLGSLAGRRFLIIGAGRMAELAIKHIQDEAPASVGVLNRTITRAQDLAARYGAMTWSSNQLELALRDSDIVVSCTSAPGIVIEADIVAQVLEARQDPLLLLDLAVPRDIDRQIAALPGARLFDVDDMQELSAANREMRAAEIAGAEALIEAEAQKFMEWWTTQQVVPTIRALRERAEAIRTAELQRTFARLPDLSQREQEAIRALSAAIVNKLLHQPITALKDPAVGGQLVQPVHTLFQLPDMKKGPNAIES